MATYRKRLGRWRAEIKTRGVRMSATFDSKADARAWATLHEHEIASKAHRKAHGLHALTDALERYKLEVSPTHRGRRWEEARIGVLQRDPIAGVRLRDLSPDDIAGWRDRRLARVLPGSVNREWNLLRSVLESARREWRWIGANPMTDVRRPRSPPARDRRVSDDELRRMSYALGWDCVSPPVNASQRLAVMAWVAVETGMRAGELVGLTWERTHLVNNYVELVRTKNGDARHVPLSQQAQRLIKIIPKDEGIDSVFSVQAATRDALWRKARTRCGLVDLHFHDLRHEAATRIAPKLDLLDLCRMFGHRDVNSFRIYYNPTATEIAARLAAR